MDRLVTQPKARHRYSLEELLAQCDENETPGSEDRAWIDSKPVGGELL